MPVDLEQLAMLLDAGGEYATGGRIDLRNGDVWPEHVFDDARSASADDIDDEDRWLTVWPLGSRAAYADMVNWAATRTGRLRDQLDVAREGRGAFRRFKNALSDWHDDRASFAVQIAKSFGAEVTGVCSTAKTDLVTSIGADHVIDYTERNFADGPQRYDLILDIGGDSPLSRLRRALTRRGTLVIIGGENSGRWTV